MDPNDARDAFGSPSHEEWARLGRYIVNRCTPEEAHAVERWIAELPARRELVERMRRARSVTGAATELWDVDDGWNRLVERVEHEAAEPPPAPLSAVSADVVPLRPRSAPPARRRRTAGVGTALRVAAVLVAVLGGALLWQNRAPLGPGEASAPKELATTAGQHARIHLGDGTEIVLGPASRIQYPERFDRTREVRLEGEAVFDVATDHTRPFLVRAGPSLTRVLGTRFGVKAYRDDGYVDVVVVEGRVAVSSTANPDITNAESSGVTLTPGLAVRVGLDGALMSPRRVDADQALSWTEGRLVFDGAPLAEVARTLARRYPGFRLELADSAVAATRLTAEFREPAAAEVARLISLSLGLGYRRTDDGFLLFRPASEAGVTRP